MSARIEIALLDSVQRAQLRFNKHRRRCFSCSFASRHGLMVNPDCTRGRFLRAMYSEKVRAMARATRDAQPGGVA